MFMISACKSYLEVDIGPEAVAAWDAPHITIQSGIAND
jgi:hypothetical protein